MNTKQILLFVASMAITLECAIAEETKIQDNSFLIEEAYNQEPGVVQHISLFDWKPEDETWDYSFTQEWPVLSQTHQFSYTIPVSDVGSDTGVGDILLNYRYQALSDDRVAFAPRLSLIVPSGASEKFLGNDTVGYQLNLPLSVELTDSIVMHWNLGATFSPDSKAAEGGRASAISLNYGASIIYLSTSKLNFMLEMVGSSDETSVGSGHTARQDSFVLSPGVRYAFDFDSGLQIVPGVAIPIGFGPSEGDYGLIGYLSFEHPF